MVLLARSDETRGPTTLDPAVIDGVAQRLAHLGDGRLLRLLPARLLLRHADQHVGRRAELLQLHLAEAQSAQRRAHLGDVGRSGPRLHLDQRAADEIDAEVQSVEEEQQDGDDGQGRGYRS